jgi:hypothetical protein
LTFGVAETPSGENPAGRWLNVWLYRLYFSLAVGLGKWFPREWKKRWGTVTLTAVGMVGKGAGWGIPPSSPSICWITLGDIGQKREDLDGQFATREYLSLTVSFDHRTIDGALAARFTERFKELIETGYGLPLGEEAIAEPIASQPMPEPSCPCTMSGDEVSQAPTFSLEPTNVPPESSTKTWHRT